MTFIDCAAHLRTLHNTTALFDEKLQAAQTIYDTLLVSELEGSPEFIRAHYISSLFEWILQSISKVEQSHASVHHKQNKTNNKKTKGETQTPKVPPHSSSQLQAWKLLVSLLQHPYIQQSQPSFPGSIIHSMTQSLQSPMSTSTSTTEQPERAATLACLLSLLQTHYSTSFKPSLEHAVSLVYTCITLHIQKENEAGEENKEGKPYADLANASLSILMPRIQQHPNQRKVWDAIVPKLFSLLVQVAFSSTISDIRTTSRAVLKSVLFHQQHLPSIYEACKAHQKDGTSNYTSQLFTQIHEILKENSIETAPPLLRSMEWLVKWYCSALHVYNNTTSHSIESLKSIQSHQGSGIPAAESPLPKKGDFIFFKTITQLLLNALDSLPPPPLSSSSPSCSPHIAAVNAALDMTLWSLADVCSTLKSCRIYRPTEDADGTTKAYLGAIVQFVLQYVAVSENIPEKKGGKRGMEEGKNIERAVPCTDDASTHVQFRIVHLLCHILEVEHRVVQGHLHVIWPLLWHLHSMPSIHFDAIGANKNHVASDESYTLAPHTELGCRLVDAYAELRLLSVLLSSYIDAVCAANSNSSSLSSFESRDTKFDSIFFTSLKNAFGSVPSGQVPVLIKEIAAWIRQLKEIPGRGRSAAGGVLLHLSTACITCVPLDMTNAHSTASSCYEVLESLSENSDFLEYITRNNRNKSNSKDDAWFAVLLSVYNLIVQLHSKCCLTLPQLNYLPGQEGASTRDGESYSESDLGYFSSLYIHHHLSHTTTTTTATDNNKNKNIAHASPSLPSSPSLAAASHIPVLRKSTRNKSTNDHSIWEKLHDTTCSSSFKSSLLYAAQQRLYTLYYRELYQASRCSGVDIHENLDEKRSQERKHEMEIISLHILKAVAPADQSSSILPLIAWLDPLEFPFIFKALDSFLPENSLEMFASMVVTQCVLLEEYSESFVRSRVYMPVVACRAIDSILSGDLEISKEKASSKPALENLLSCLKKVSKGNKIDMNVWNTSLKMLILVDKHDEDEDNAVRTRRKKRKIEIDGASHRSKGESLQKEQIIIYEKLSSILSSLACTAPKAAASLDIHMAISLLCVGIGTFKLQTQQIKSRELIGRWMHFMSSALGMLSSVLSSLRELSSSQGSHQIITWNLIHTLMDTAEAVVHSVEHTTLPPNNNGSDHDEYRAVHQLDVLCDIRSTMTLLCKTLLTAGNKDADDVLLENIKPARSKTEERPVFNGRWLFTESCLAACLDCIAMVNHNNKGYINDDDDFDEGHAETRMQEISNFALLHRSKENNKQEKIASLIDVESIANIIRHVDATLPRINECTRYDEKSFSSHHGNNAATVLLTTGSIAACASHIESILCTDPTFFSSGKSVVLSHMNEDVIAVFHHLSQYIGSSFLLAPSNTRALTAALVQCLDFIQVVCKITTRAKPAVSLEHYASVLSMIVSMLCMLPIDDTLIEARRVHSPLTSHFPAATHKNTIIRKNTTMIDHHYNDDAWISSSYISFENTAAAFVLRKALLNALSVLFAGSTSQQMQCVVSFIERTLTFQPGSTRQGNTSGNNKYILVIVELSLMAVERCKGKATLRTLCQRCERLASCLISTIVEVQQPTTLSEYQLNLNNNNPNDSDARVVSIFNDVLQSILNNNDQQHIHSFLLDGGRKTDAIHSHTEKNNNVGIDMLICATALRVLESLIARPKLFALSSSHITRALHSVACLWSAINSNTSITTTAEHHFSSCHASAFINSCCMVSSMLRHREETLSRSMHVVVDALRILLIALVRALEYTQNRGVVDNDEGVLDLLRCCSNGLGAVFQEFASLKASSKYCPHIIGDYLILVASPMTTTSKNVLRVRAHTHMKEKLSGFSSISNVVDDVEENEDQDEASTRASLRMHWIIPGVRQGVYALYDACDSAGIQYLFASLGGKGGSGVWRAALSTLKSEYDANFKYTGKV